MPERDPEQPSASRSPRGSEPRRASLNEVITPLGSNVADAPNRFGVAIVLLLPLMAGFAAAAFGGVEPWSELILFVASTIAAAFAIFDAGSRGINRTAATALAFVLAYAGLVASQILPVPIEALRWLSPARYATLTTLLQEAPNFAAMSYYRIDTIQSLRLVFVALAVFAAAIAVSRSVAYAKLLLLGLFLLGVGEACLAVAQQATDASGIYWSDIAARSIRSGSFVNHSNFSQFLNLTIGAGLGLLLVRLSEDQKTGTYGRRQLALSEIFRRHGWLLIGIALQVVAIAASLSRAGIIAMVVATALTSLSLRRSSVVGSSGWALLVVPAAAFGLLVVLGFDAFYHRIDTLQGTETYTDRIDLGISTLAVGWDHPLFGTGLGTHSSVFPSYDSTGSIAVAEQADNDYAQAFEETGLLGVAILGGLLTTVAIAIYRVTAMRHSSAKHAAYGVMYGLVAVGVQSLTDFGQRVPAIFCVTAILAGIVIGLSPQRESSRSVSRAPRWLVATVCALLVGCGGFYLAATGLADYRASRWWAVAYDISESLQAAGVDADPQEYLDRIAAAEMASAMQPARIEHAFWLNAYRWEALQFASGGSDPATTPEGRATMLRIADELAEARRLCPTHGPSNTLEGQLRVAAGDLSGIELVERGVRLAPNDPVSCYAAAVQILAQPSNESADAEAYKLLRRAVGLDRLFFTDSISAVIEARSNLPMAIKLCDGLPNRLRELARQVEGVEELASQAPALREQALAAQEAIVAGPNTWSGEIADLARRLAYLGRLDEAVALYRRALALDFNRQVWRMALIEALQKLDRNKEALREARIAVRLQPQDRQAIGRLEELIDLVEADDTAAAADGLE